jgi:hydrogenase maturation protease
MAQEDHSRVGPGGQLLAGNHTEVTLPAPTIIIGLGNPILGDDGAGWAVASEVARRLEGREEFPPAVVECLSLGGLSLMEHLIGYERAILIDVVNLGSAPPGTLYKLPLASLPEHRGSHTGSAHDTSLHQALKMGISMGANLPTDIQVIGIHAEIVYDFSEQFSEPVAAAVLQAAELVIQVLVQGGDPPPSRL